MRRASKVECRWCGKVTNLPYRSDAKYCPPQPGDKQSGCLLARNRALRREVIARQKANPKAKPPPMYQYECIVCGGLTGGHPRCGWCGCLIHDGDTKKVDGKQVCHECLRYRDYKPAPIEQEVYVKPGFDYGG